MKVFLLINYVKIFSALGPTGAPDKIYELSRNGNDLELGWTIPALNTFSNYEICIEPVPNPAAFTASVVTKDQQKTDLANGVNTDLSRRYRWGVITNIEGANKVTQFSDPICDSIDLSKFQMDN